MCGIIGYIGERPALEVVLHALHRMEYRGYDSAGIAIVSPEGDQVVTKKAGKLANLQREIAGKEALFQGHLGIGHTRWATHGRPTDKNAHPHLDASGKIALVHNGIVENSSAYLTELETAGIELVSDTDSEVVVKLVGKLFAETSGTKQEYIDTIFKVLNQLKGAFTVVFSNADFPDLIVAARKATPLVLGVGDNEYFVASDIAAFIDYTKQAVEIGDNQVVVVADRDFNIYDFAGNKVAGKEFTIDWGLAEVEKAGFDSFMLKEINEQPEAIANTLAGHFQNGRIVLDELRLSDEDLRDIDKVFIVACGSAFHAGFMTKYVIEHWARIPCEVELASEFRYRDPILDRSTLVIAISQSGETADTLEAVRHARSQKALVLAITNRNGSLIARESDAVLYTHAGLEVAVASTKAFLAQLAAGYLVGLAIAQARGIKYPGEVAREYVELNKMPEKIGQVLNKIKEITTVANKYKDADTILFIGRHVGYPIALEGALKLKELAYIHAEGFAAGELKHGPIALIEEGLPVIILLPSPVQRPTLHSKMISNIREIQARGAKTIIIAEEGDEEADKYADELITVPVSPTLYQPLLTTIPLQVLAAAIATAKGYDVDKPRNLAKSVTVE